MSDEETLFAEADAYDAAETARLRRGEPAFTPGHFYFAYGNISDIYFCRASPDARFASLLVRADPIHDDDAMLEAASVVLVIQHNGRCFRVVDEGYELIGWTARDFTPFGRTQMHWLAQLQAHGHITFTPPEPSANS